MALAIIEFSVSTRLLPFQQTQIRTLGSLSGLSDKDSASPWFGHQDFENQTKNEEVMDFTI